MENKKIAICLSGGVKFPERCIESLNTFFKDKDVKIFAHVWEIKDRNSFNKNSWTGMGQAGESKIADNIDEVRKFIDFEKIKIEKFDSMIPVFEGIKQQFSTFTDRRDVGPISMMYSICQSDSLRTAYETQLNSKFDLVIRMRFDSAIESINFDNTENVTIHIPRGNDWNGINDQFAYGDSTAMNVYSSLYLNLLKFNNVLYNPEVLLKNYLNATGIKIKRTEDIIKAMCPQQQR